MTEGPSISLSDVWYYADEFHSGLVERCATCGKPLWQEGRSWLSTHADCLKVDLDGRTMIRVSLTLTNVHPT